jgi:type IV secretory pathway VirJ component
MAHSGLPTVSGYESAATSAKASSPAEARGVARVVFMRVAALLVTVLPTLAASAAPPTTESVAIRGQAQSVRVYGKRGAPVAIVASGDGGWVHLGPYVAEFLSRNGYFVVGFDSKAYLSSFTKGDKTLSTTDVPGDFAALVDYASQGAAGPPVLLGVSEGAALAILAVASDATKAKVAGVVGLGLPDQAELAWRFRDSMIYVTKGVPKEPLFSTAEVIGRVTPLPVVAIHSTTDEFVSVDDIKRVMGRALEPKQLWLIEAQDHRFSGKEQELNQKLLDAIAWIKARHS